MRPNKNCGMPTNPRHCALPTPSNQQTGHHWREAGTLAARRIC
jgi:hypothetical protein